MTTIGKAREKREAEMNRARVKAHEQRNRQAGAVRFSVWIDPTRKEKLAGLAKIHGSKKAAFEYLLDNA